VDARDQHRAISQMERDLGVSTAKPHDEFLVRLRMMKFEQRNRWLQIGFLSRSFPPFTH
jgi:hypothetical protein